MEHSDGKLRERENKMTIRSNDIWSQVRAILDNKRYTRERVSVKPEESTSKDGERRLQIAAYAVRSHARYLREYR